MLETKRVVDPERLRTALSAKGVVVVFPGPKLPQRFSVLKPSIDRYVVVSVDGATSYLLEQGVIPEVVVTDLDGGFEPLRRANEMGSVLVVHAHGDNIPLVEGYVSCFSGALIGSTQVEPRPRVHNFGGFTDGDRALFLLWSLGIREALLVGADFRGEIGGYSTRFKEVDEEYLEAKRGKMEVAKWLISWLVDRGMSLKSLGDSGHNRVEVVEDV